MAALNHAKIINALEEITGKAEKAAEVAAGFILDFLHAYGTPKATLKRIQAGDRQRNIATIPGDVAVAQKLYYRPVRAGESVSAALEDVRALPLLQQQKIRFVLVTDFTTVAAYDRKVDDATTFDFCDLKTNYEFFLPLTGKYEKAIEYAEHPADVKACEKMGRLYDSIRTINHYEKDDLHTLNVFLTRLLFCFFAEDTGIFPHKNQMSNAIQSLTLEDGSDMDAFFSTFFTVLNLPDTAPERKAQSVTLQAFPYVNGGLFQEQAAIPKFNTKARRLLLECGAMTWGEISPVIFGSMFQAVMDPERRRSMGAHYTSEKNILKVVRPLFLDALHEEFAQIAEMKRGKIKALKAFHTKLGSLGFLDPACGCGNFLVVSYRELRELELRVVLAMRDEEPKSLALDVKFLSKVNINQFYGIELEEFPVEIARVSLWLMEHVMNVKFGAALGLVFPSIPLHHSAEIVCANALTIPWESVIAPEKLSFILGNPPFAGKHLQTNEQRAETLAVFYGNRKAASLDFVACWFKKAAAFLIQNQEIEIAFVATNSITQGEQVAILWPDLLAVGVKINFAYRTFKWSSEATGSAAVHCVIIGYALKERKDKCIFNHNVSNCEYSTVNADIINPYLLAAPNVLPSSRLQPICDVPLMRYGSKPADGGHLLLTKDDRASLISECNAAEQWIKPFLNADEFLSGLKRYCLWLPECSPEQLQQMPPVQKRIEAVRQMRLRSKKAKTRELAQEAHLFAERRQPNSSYMLIPGHTSENRNYIPIGYCTSNFICGNANFAIEDATPYDFGILTSAMHMAWMRTVCGRLEMRYRYSASIVYNTFPWPTVTPQQQKNIEALADTVLMTREMYPDMTLAQMYDPDTMPVPLREAHTALDVAVDRLYRAKPFDSEEQRLQLLFELYENLVREKPQNDAASVNCDAQDDDTDNGECDDA